MRPSFFQTKYSLEIHHHKLLGSWFYLDYFLNMGFYYIALQYRYRYNNKQPIGQKNPRFMICVGITRRAAIGNVGNENVGSAGQTGFSHRALECRVTKIEYFFCT